ncbi:hypothetical protein MATL_G00207110 [Megalops atlanticus]|uniref:Uncharacterized protein n=1 Tax=Megalops atlanticus TaxID=7932 RepID=A0A9D3SYT4_MEGAT|nr:hypothetical protein MATL_G00207110 [Megalops atlanticus]
MTTIPVTKPLGLRRRVGLRRSLPTGLGKIKRGLSVVEREVQEREREQESVLALLGVIGTVLNLIVIIIVYIYTSP